MIKSCIFLLLVTVCSVHCYVISNSSQKEIASSYLDVAADMISKAKKNIPTCDDYPKVPTKKAVDCADVLQMGHNKSGVYEVWPASRLAEDKHLYVYCDMETDGGGWTVLQRRGDFQRQGDYFFQDWKSYKEGFGAIEKDFWLGNDNIFALTNQKLYSVRFDLKDFEKNKRYALYEKFWIDSEEPKYTIHISSYSGDAGDSMWNHDNMPFSTKDQENDRHPTKHCARVSKGGWWYHACHGVNLNGLYRNGKYVADDAISWNSWKGAASLAWTEMKIRPKHFRHPVS